MHLLGLVLALWGGTLFYLPFFRITDVSYQGLRLVKPGEIAGVVNTYLGSRRFLFPANNFFLVNLEELRQRISEKFAVAGVVVTKVFPRTLSVILEENVSSLIYDTAAAYYLLDERGAVLRYLQPVEAQEFSTSSPSWASILTKSASSTAGTEFTAAVSSTSTDRKWHIPNTAALATTVGAYPVLYDFKRTYTTATIAIGEQAVGEKEIEGLIKFYRGLKKQGKEKLIRYFVLIDSTEGMVGITDQFWHVYFRPENNIEAQLDNFFVLLRDFKPTQYVDLRFGERVYWK